MRSGTQISGDGRSEKVGISAAYHLAGVDRARRAEAAAPFLWAARRFALWCFTKYPDMPAQKAMRMANELCQTANMLALPISDGMKKRLAKNSSKGRLSLYNYAIAILENHK